MDLIEKTLQEISKGNSKIKYSKKWTKKQIETSIKKVITVNVSEKYLHILRENTSKKIEVLTVNFLKACLDNYKYQKTASKYL